MNSTEKEKTFIGQKRNWSFIPCASGPGTSTPSSSNLSVGTEIFNGNTKSDNVGLIAPPVKKRRTLPPFYSETLSANTVPIPKPRVTSQVLLDPNSGLNGFTNSNANRQIGGGLSFFDQPISFASIPVAKPRLSLIQPTQSYMLSNSDPSNSSNENSEVITKDYTQAVKDYVEDYCKYLKSPTYRNKLQNGTSTQDTITNLKKNKLQGKMSNARKKWARLQPNDNEPKTQSNNYGCNIL